MTTSLTIYIPQGGELLTTPINEGCKRHFEMGESDYITVKFSSLTPLYVPVGSYIKDLRFGWFVFTDETYKPTYNTETGGYDYELQFDAWYFLFKKYIFKYVPSSGGAEASWSLTQTLAVFGEIFLSNIKALGMKYNNADYTWNIDSSVSTEAKYLTFADVSMYDALIQMAEEWECEWWVVGNAIHFGKCELAKDPIEFKLGGRCLSIDSTQSSDDSHNRYYVFGSNRNITKKYRKSLIFDVTTAGTDIGDEARPLKQTYVSESKSQENIYTDKNLTAGSSWGSGLMNISNPKVSTNATTEYELSSGEWTIGANTISGTITLSANSNGGVTVMPTAIDIELVGVFNDDASEVTIAKGQVGGVGTMMQVGVAYDIVLTPEESFTLNAKVSDFKLGWRFTAAANSQDNFACYIKLVTAGGYTITHKETYWSADIDVTFTSGSLGGKTLTCTYNPAATSEGAGVIELPSGYSASVGDHYTIAEDCLNEHLVPAYYYTSKYSSDIVVEGIVQSRIMLPESLGKNYIDAFKYSADGELIPITDSRYDDATNVEMDIKEVNETILILDDVYPQTECEITEISTEENDVYNKDDGSTSIVTWYNIKWSGSKMYKKYIVENKNISLTFSSGLLTGMTFELIAKTTDNGEITEFQIRQNDDYGRDLPDTVLCPKVGDTFAFINWDSSMASDADLVSDAETELYDTAVAEIKKMTIDPKTYECTVKAEALEDGDASTAVSTDITYGDKRYAFYELGQPITLIDPTIIGGTRLSRIIGWEFPLDKPIDNPVFYVGESVAYSRLSDMQSQIDTLTYNGSVYTSTGGNGSGASIYLIKKGDATIPTDDNAYSAKAADYRFLSSLTDDTAEGIITFLKGIKIGQGGKYYIDNTGQAALRQLILSGKLTVGGDASITGDTSVGGKLTVEGLATLASLYVEGQATFGDTLSTEDFVSGFLSGKGWAIMKQQLTNAAGAVETKYTAEFDNLIIRGSLRVYEMIISQLLGENDNRVFTAMMEVDHYDPETGKVYLDTQEGKLYNPFRKDDYVMVQQYNGMPSEENGYYVTKHYELIITAAGCGETTDGENRLDWVKIANFTSSDGATAEEVIAKNDTFVRVDNLTDEERKGIVTITTVGSNTPYLDFIYGMKTDPDNYLKGRMGNLGGIRHHLFGWLEGFGNYLQNLYATGDFRLRRTGESLDQKIEAVKGMLASQMSQKTYELSDNMIHNGEFAMDLDGWTYDDDSQLISINDEALLVNTVSYSTDTSRVYVVEDDGRKVLDVSDATLSQDVSLITPPTTHYEYAESTDESTTTADCEEVADTVYLAVKYKALRAGALTFEMEGNTGTLPLKSIVTTVDYEWHVAEVSGTWDGQGGFTLAVDGEVEIAFVSLTTKPVEELSKTVSTNIEQTATNIRITGKNIDKVMNSVTELGVNLDAELKELGIYVDEENAAQDEEHAALVATVGQLQSTVTSNKTETDGKITSLSSQFTQTASGLQGQITANYNTFSNKIADLEMTADEFSLSYADGELSRINLLSGAYPRFVGQGSTPQWTAQLEAGKTYTLSASAFLNDSGAAALCVFIFRLENGSWKDTNGMDFAYSSDKTAPWKKSMTFTCGTTATYYIYAQPVNSSHYGTTLTSSFYRLDWLCLVEGDTAPVGWCPSQDDPTVKTDLLLSTAKSDSDCEKIVAPDGTYKYVYHFDNSSGAGGSWADKIQGVVRVEKGKTYTLSFWAKGSGDISCYLYQTGVTATAWRVCDQLAFGEDTAKRYTSSSDGHARMTLDSSWHFYEVTFTAAYTGGVNCLVGRIWNGSNMYIYGWKLETGGRSTEMAAEDAKQLAEDNVATLETYTNNYINSLQSQINTANSEIDGIDSEIDGIDSTLSSHATLITSNSNSIAAVAGRFNSDGSLAELSGYVATSSFASLFTTYMNSNGLATTSYVTTSCNRVSLGVKNGLKSTGIDIGGNTITLDADNLICKNGDNEVTMYIDSETGDLHINGIVNAKVFYSPVLDVRGSNYTVMSSGEVDAHTFIVGGSSSNTTQKATLPKAAVYEGMELQFFNPCTSKSSYGATIYANTVTGGTPPLGTSLSFSNYICWRGSDGMLTYSQTYTMPTNRMVTFKAFLGNWYVISGGDY